ncbi:MAG: SDR family oxidoreductase [Verrucomicrobiota bacterium]
MKLFDLDNDLAVIIGATGVLGGALAEGLAMAGAQVIIAGRNSERGLARVNSIKSKGGEAAFIEMHANSKESLESGLKQILKDYKTPTILVNAAGGNSPDVTVTDQLAFEDIEESAWHANFDMNLVGGALLPCQVFGGAMINAGEGSIINIASVSAHLPLSRVVSYSASKAAVLNLTTFLAREWATRGVRVNSITPGFFPAEQNKKLLFKEDGAPTARAQQILGHTSMQRFGQPEELVGAAIFLASSMASSFVTGADIRVDGGFLSQTI